MKLLLALILIFLINCQEEYDKLDYLGRNNYTLSAGTQTIKIKLDISKIDEGDYTYFSLIINDPTYIPSFRYKYLISNETKNFTTLEHNAVINNWSEHTVYYKAKKTSKDYKIILLEITVSTTVEGQAFSVLNTESQLNITMLIILIVVGSTVLCLAIVGLSLYFVHKKRRPVQEYPNPIDENLNGGYVPETANIALT